MSTKDRNREGLDPEPLWYKSGVIYELHVRAFFDSDDNGVGDFRGLTAKLDYLKDLGITALWLLPFYPSPLKDDGYDIADYYDVHPMYGTLADFKTFLREAHRRGLRVIMELVMNHTSDQHAWFRRARRAKPGSRWREFYVWSDTPEKYRGTRIIFKDVEYSNWAWDPVAHAYYWHRFFSHQPDLNYDNPEIHEEMLKVVDFWLDLGVDGLRLDAVPYLYEREGTSCENLPETHAFLKKIRAHVDANYDDRLLLGEANQWPEDAVAYFGQDRGDECHMAFHFPLMPRLFMALRMEDRTPIVDILEQTPTIPDTCQWALFLRNHDELTLEMVTDEERDYMYRTYAHVHQARLNLGIRRRLAPLLGNDRKRIELLNALLFSLPGTPVLYYGDEIGMGENIYLGDRNGVRTPMQWSSDKNAGFSRANPQRLYLPIIYDPEYHYEAINVEAQLPNPHSLLWWTRRLLALRKRRRALGEGKCEFLQPKNRRILAYILRHGRETLLVVANLSRYVQPVDLDLAPFKGLTPVELFGRMEFPKINETPYFLTLGPHTFFWFSLEDRQQTATSLTGPILQQHALTVPNQWPSLLTEKFKEQLESALPGWLQTQRWFGGKTKAVKLVTIIETIPVVTEPEPALLTFLQVDYVEEDPEFYTLPLAFATGHDAEALQQRSPSLVIASLTAQAGSQTGLLYDAIGNPVFARTLLDTIAHRHHIGGVRGTMQGIHTTALRDILGENVPPPSLVGKAMQNNSSVSYGDKLILKMFRRIEPGRSSDFEIGEFLTTKSFPNVPSLAGGLRYAGTTVEEDIDLAVLHGFIPNAKGAWTEALDVLSRYYDRVISLTAHGEPVPVAAGMKPVSMQEDLPSAVREIVGTYLEAARLLGERTAALHLILASDAENPDFAPEPFTPHYARGLFQSMRNLAIQNLRLLNGRIKTLPDDVSSLAQQVLDREPQIVKCYRALVERCPTAARIRTHGDFHLGQVLWTGKDFIILDFEGEPALALSERRIKRSPLRDVAGMVRSFHYAAWAGLHQHVQRGGIEQENLAKHEPWARLWYQAVSSVYLRAYRKAMGESDVLPRSEEEWQVMLPAYLLHKAVYEIGYELNNRPSWLPIPLQGALLLLESEMP